MTTKRKPRRKRLTEDEKLQRRAARKAKALNDKVRVSVGPLFVAQIPPEQLTNQQEQYWRARRGWALAPRGHEAAYLARIEWKVDLMIVRNVARKVMSAEDFAIASAKQSNFGDSMGFWRNILLGKQRIVLDYERTTHGWKPCWSGRDWKVCCEHGCSKCEAKLICYLEDVRIRERLVWPPAGWVPPLTREQLDNLIALPLPLESGFEATTIPNKEG